MNTKIPGLHHVTAISGAPQRNVDFYMGLLGQRLVKKTVNFDDPGTYHFYYGDETGAPGTLMTFFPWASAVPGRAGAGTTGATAYSVPVGAIDFWMARLADAGHNFEAPSERFGDNLLRLQDPDGMWIELIEHEGAEAQPFWAEGPVSGEVALRKFHSVTLQLADPKRTSRLLRDTFGYTESGQDGERLRFVATAEDRESSVVDLVPTPLSDRARMGKGTVHHVAFRARDYDEQAALREELLGQGFNVTPFIDRQYFRSIYFREPNGVLFEIATDAPGMLIDETREGLGHGLQLPAQYEPRRAEIERILTPITLPSV
ncbi:MAG: ring-cleaving dioxygenase [Rhodothermales bacterium]